MSGLINYLIRLFWPSYYPKHQPKIVEVTEEKKIEMIEIKIKLVEETRDSTVSMLIVNGRHFGYVLEDGYRKVKEYGHTRIRGGKRKVIRRKHGGFYEKYKRKFGPLLGPYKGQYILEIEDVPEFTDILLHIGNTPFAMKKKPFGESLGCLLVNTSYRVHVSSNFIGLQSKIAFIALMDYVCTFPETMDITIDIDRSGSKLIN